MTPIHGTQNHNSLSEINYIARLVRRTVSQPGPLMVCNVLPFSQVKHKHFLYNFFGFASPFSIKILPQEGES